MTEEKLAVFIEAGGIHEIGHPAFALLSLIVQKAKEREYPDTLDIAISEIMFKGKINGYNQLKKAREVLIINGLIQKYENFNRSASGTFFLKYD